MAAGAPKAPASPAPTRRTNATGITRLSAALRDLHPGRGRQNGRAMRRLWCNGQWLAAGEFPAAVLDRGSLLGLGLFETLLGQDGRAVFAELHLARLAAGCERLGWVPPQAEFGELVPVMERLLREEGLGAGSARLRLTVTADTGPLAELAARPPPWTAGSLLPLSGRPACWREGNGYAGTHFMPQQAASITAAAGCPQSTAGPCQTLRNPPLPRRRAPATVPPMNTPRPTPGPRSRITPARVQARASCACYSGT